MINFFQIDVSTFNHSKRSRLRERATHDNKNLSTNKNITTTQHQIFLQINIHIQLDGARCWSLQHDQCRHCCF